MDLHTIQPKIAAETETLYPEDRGIRISNNEMNLIPLKSFFQMQSPNRQEQEQLNWIYKFYEKEGLEDMGSVLVEIQKIINKLGRPMVGSTPLAQVYQYLKIMTQMGDLKEIKKGLEHGTTT